MASRDPDASSITVAVRVRPFTIREAAQLVRNDEATLFLGDGSLAGAPQPKLRQHGIRSVIKVVDDRCLVFDPPEDNPVQKFSRSVVPTGKKVKDQVFAFDRIFDDNATQTEVYEGTTKNLLDSVLDGYNATVFAYGATGCGKTHTITGTSAHPGIIFLTMQELFEKINDRREEKVTELSLSYLEIYNETIRDLLVPGGSKQGLMLREDSNQAVSVAGLTSHHPKDVQEVMDMIVQGNEYRTVSPTAANAVSSRSHAVLQINIAQKNRNSDLHEAHTMSTLSIIDLAGSERASATKNRGERLMEGANINKSLLALGSCINALCDPRKKNHVPYRNSKLTRLLKFSLGGNCKTVMIVCVSPSSEHFDESQNTLRYANRAKNIQTKVTRNVFNVNRHVKDYLVKIDEQMALITELKAQQRDAERIFGAKFRKQAEKRDTACREGIARLRIAYENSARERQERINNMRRLKAFERRIDVLSAWIAAFDHVCQAHSSSTREHERDKNEAVMPQSLAAIRKTAHGILVELENSRHHIHQKLERTTWERALDSALNNSLAQLSNTELGNVDGGERDALAREAELLKSNFMRDAYYEVLKQDKAGDAAILQVVLTSHFDMLASLADTLAMSEEDAVTHAKTIINRLLEAGYSAASHVVKPENGPGGIAGATASLTAGVMPMERFPPSKRGTPRRKRSSVGPASKAPRPVLSLTVPATSVSTGGTMSPISKMAASPRRARKAGLARRSLVAFTPVKKSPVVLMRRSVRWRDDETEDGTLADYAKTPQKFDSSPSALDSVSPAKPVRDQSDGADDDADVPPRPPSRLSYLDEPANTSSPVDHVDRAAGPSQPPPASIPTVSTATAGARPNRFQDGFLSKSRLPSLDSAARNGSPIPPNLSLPLGASSSSVSDSSSRETTPLRSIPISRATNSLAPLTGKSTGSPKIPVLSSSWNSQSANNSLLSIDENRPPSHSNSPTPMPPTISAAMASGCNSDSDSSLLSTLDARKLRSALHMTKHRRDRLSLAVGGPSASHVKRMSSGSNNGGGGGGGGGSFNNAGHSRPAVINPLASSTNGISRHRRTSGGADGRGRKFSPPISCSPPDQLGPLGGRLGGTPGHTRRMLMSGSLRGWANTSPQEGRDGPVGTGFAGRGAARRVTIGSGDAGGGGGSGGVGPGALASGRTQRPNVLTWR